jgi:hypothetical protein
MTEESEKEEHKRELIKKLAHFNVHSKDSKPVSGLEAWLRGKERNEANMHYNFAPQPRVK